MERTPLDTLLAGLTDPVALANLGMRLIEAGRPVDAEAALRRAARLLPGHPVVAYGLGLALQAEDRLDEAAEFYAEALAARPDLAPAWNNLGNIHKELQEPERALDCFERALAIAPDDARAHFNRALALLALGRRDEGWREFRWRHIAAGVGAKLPGREWDGSGPVAVHAEGGLGDTIHFLRFAGRLAASGIDVHLRVQPALVGLARSLRGIAGVAELGAPAPDGCGHAWLLDLPALAGEGAADGRPYLTAPTDSRLRLDPPRGRRVALCWAGNPRFDNDRRRSVPFAMLAPLLECREVEWVSVQVGERAVDLAGSAVLDLSPRLTDLSETAAALHQADLLVTVDTAVAHLAGAIGTPAWLLLPYSPDWRWGATGERTGLYDSLRLFRQVRRGDWPEVIGRIAARLTETG